jgi:hypothetical protein
LSYHQVIEETMNPNVHCLWRISGVDVVRAYVAALGGTIDVVARVGDRSWKVA